MRLIVFDCDGTLVDSQFRITEAMRRAFAAVDRPAPDFAAVRQSIGLTLEMVLLRLLPDATPQERQTIEGAYRAAFLEMRTQEEPEPLFPGVREAIAERLAAGDKLAIATGKGQRALRALLSAHGLLASFDALKTADDGPGKPNPAILLAAMGECGAAPEDTFMVGDTSFDMEMARFAGAHALGVAWGYHEPSALLAAGAAIILDSPAALGPVLERLRP